MKKLLPLAIVAAALLAGCGKPEDKFVGMWDGSIEVPQSTIDSLDKKMPGLGKMMTDQMKLLAFGLELKKDGTYALTTTSNGNPSVSTGTWTLSKDAKTVTMSAPQMSEADKTKARAAGMTDDMLNKAAGQALTCTVAEGGKSMSYKETRAGMESSMTFTKKGTP